MSQENTTSPATTARHTSSATAKEPTAGGGTASITTALSPAFPQPAPGTAPAPGPMKVDPERLKSVLGIANVTFIPGRAALAIADNPLSGLPPAFDAASHEAMLRRQTAKASAPLGAN